MITVQMRIAMTEAQENIPAEGTLEEKLKAAMRVTKGHWMCTVPDQRFRAAVGAVMVHCGEGSPELSRLEIEMRNLQRLSAFISAGGQARLPIDAFAAMFEEKHQSRNGEEGAIPLLKLWYEVQDEKG